MFSAEHYVIASSLLPRLLGAIYFIAFFPFLFQIRGLIGKQGILPVGDFLNFYRNRLKHPMLHLPTVFWLNHSDKALMTVVSLGIFLSLLLMAGFNPLILLPILIVLHLSIVTAGQDFLGFGWEGYFLELSYHAFFLALTDVPNLFVWLSVNLLIFRSYLQAGTCKLQSRDPSWKNLSALHFHYQTQPLPNTIAWYVHKMPESFHRFSVLAMLAIEIGAPFLIFGTENMRFLAFILYTLLQVAIWISGNYSYLNYLTVVMASLLISDSYFPFEPTINPSSFAVEMLAGTGGIVLLMIQLMAIVNHFYRIPQIQKILYLLFPYHLGNRFGIFAIMTTERYEVVVEGSEDQITWKEYLFKFKPSETTRRPRRIAPYQPRLDWQAWFLPFEEFSNKTWFKNFLMRLFEGSPHVLSLLRYNPFSDAPPRFLRAQLYLYEFSDRKTRKETGQWWVRRLIGPYSPEFKNQGRS